MLAKLFGYRRDPHNGPHMMNQYGGCHCTCDQCIRYSPNMWRCICPRCNEECTGFGRLGGHELMMQERERGEPNPALGKPAKRWYRP